MRRVWDRLSGLGVPCSKSLRLNGGKRLLWRWRDYAGVPRVGRVGVAPSRDVVAIEQAIDGFLHGCVQGR